ncbi:alcohol dehydrogenase catalytic domain-containing protein [Phenylobacterium sp. J367]|uniref:alcohol dehydrogenase catalytic domain-containing protein n=1 Tax=Phenylobacterium sp. J367 TaxID=2898435 RepID=UPI002151B316|nr:alcohol dehydrogenase catalytic domain-containing protein [Phenylobacterium sp. J367]MCR5879272.1 alcohol dehydrogenase catalytic domain-containing protein [Phenylobacterium sp. J367]
MVLHEPRTPLRLEVRPDPEPSSGEVRIRVRACGVCRTDLHVVDGDLAPRRSSVVPGHEIVGVVDALGDGVEGGLLGRRVGVPWLGETCGRCSYCATGEENLCDRPSFTGWTRDGGYADTAIARAEFVFPVPEDLSDLEAAPLMCAGLIGYRCWRKAEAARPVRRPRSLRVRRGGPPARAARGSRRPERLCLHSRGRRRRSGPGAGGGMRLGGGLGRRSAGAARCGDHLRTGGRTGALWPCGRYARAAR